MLRLLLAVLATLLAACSSTPPPAREADGAAVAVAVRRLEPRRGVHGKATTVYFVRVEDSTGLAAAPKLLESNFVRGEACCLLNAEPGTYAAVAAKEKKDGKTFVVFLPLPLIEKTMVTVGPGESAWMGQAAVHAQAAVLNQDEAQRHYRGLLEPDWSRMTAASRLFLRKYYQVVTHFTHRVNEGLREHAQRVFAEGGWK